jgi:predicted transport protein
MEKGLLEKTGKSLEHWIKVVQKAKLEGHKEMMDFLKSKHNFTHGFANFVALKARKSDAASHDEVELVANQYKGKESLKPIYKKLVAKIQKMGKDITLTPKKDSVSFIRKKQFALIKPATKTRIDVGLKFKTKPTTKRLENSGPFGAMCTHRVQVASASEIDAELLGWIEEAYEGAG